MLRMPDLMTTSKTHFTGFDCPRGHERRIHGRSHTGVRIVQEGATMMLAWTRIGIIRNRSPRKNFVPTVTRPLPKVKRQRFNDAR